jgi:flagellar hook assembly protein FlgD
MNPIGVGVEPLPPLPASVSLKQNWPNPCNPSTTIEFAVPVDARARLVIYDLRGRCVRVLLDDLVGAGWHHREWDGRDDRGRDAAAGSYLYKLAVGDRTESRTLSLVR